MQVISTEAMQSSSHHPQTEPWEPPMALIESLSIPVFYGGDLVNLLDEKPSERGFQVSCAAYTVQISPHVFDERGYISEVIIILEGDSLPVPVSLQPILELQNSEFQNGEREEGRNIWHFKCRDLRPDRNCLMSVRFRPCKV